MRIQLSPTRIVKDALTVWSEHGPEVDMVMDPKHLTFAPESIEEIYSFHVLDHLFPDEALTAATNWYQCLLPGAQLYIVTDDFEYIARGFVGGDISVDLFNQMHNNPTQFTRESGAALLSKAGFKSDDVHVWFADVPNLFPRKHFELVLDGKKAV